MHTPSLDEVRNLLCRNGRHAVLLPIQAREKRPREQGWQNRTFIQTQELWYQSKLARSPNTGVLLGHESCDLCTIDADTEAFASALMVAFPPLERTLRTRGARGCQFWAYVSGNRPKRVCPLKVKEDSPLAVGGKPPINGLVQVGEFRAEGGQSLIRGIHPDGVPYLWLCSTIPIELAFSDIPWPSELILPWVSHYCFSGGSQKEDSESDLLQRAKDRLTIDFLWNYFEFGERRSNPTHSPFREDKNPSFSIYDDGLHFKDHGTGDQGDRFDFYQRAMKQNAGQAFVGFIELAGLGDELRRNRSSTTGTKQGKTQEERADSKQGKTQEEQSDEEPPRIMIEFLRPSEILAYEPPPGIVLAGDNHIVRDSVFVLAGPPGVGKSRLLTWLARCGALLVPWMGYDTFTKFKTLIIQNENGRYRLKLEFKNLNCPELEDSLLITAPPPFGLCFDRRDFRDQLKFAADNFGPNLVAIDPWNAAARDDRAKDYLETFNDIRTVFPPGFDGPAIGIAAHTRKPYPNERASGRALLNLLAGSYVLGSIPRCVWVVQPASDDVADERIVLTCCKNNEGLMGPGPRSVWRSQNGLFVPVDGFDWDEFDHPSSDQPRYGGTIEDLFEAIPVVKPIRKTDLASKMAGKIGVNKIKEMLGQLLREGRIFLHKIPSGIPGTRWSPGYAKTPPPGTDVDIDIDDQDDDTTIDDDPR